MHTVAAADTVAPHARDVIAPARFPAVRPVVRRPFGSNRRRQFSLLIVRGDGVRVMRFNFRRPLVVAAAVALTVTGSGAVALVSDYLELRRLTREAVAMQTQLTEQRQLINTVNRRLVEVRREVAGWRDVHARIWDGLGPEGGRGTQAGIGGARPPLETPFGLRPSAIEELTGLEASVAEETDSLKALDRMMGRAKRALAFLPLRWPVRGAVNSEYGQRLSPWTKTHEFHGGIDISARPGTPVYAPSAATVAFAGQGGEYGLLVILDHGHETRTLYGHLSKIKVSQGQRLERGTEIAQTGNTGRSSGPHLHYEVLVKGKPVNPRAYLWD